MKAYLVTFYERTSYRVTADSEDEAIDLAIENDRSYPVIHEETDDITSEEIVE